MPYIQFYEDSSFQTKWRAMPCHPVSYSTIDSNTPQTITIGGKTYKYFSGYGKRLRDVFLPNVAFFISGGRSGVTTQKTFFLKNGLSLEIFEDGTTTGNIKARVTGARVGTTTISGQIQTNQTTYGCIGIAFVHNNIVYMGFGNFVSISNMGTTVIALEPYLCFEEDFWKDALRPPYDYNAGTDSNGGQATGTIPNNASTASGTPSKIIPTGGRGLHTYLINNVAYGDIQSFLWGDSSTIAKTLWQKFLNKTHSPVSCILGCYSLPSVFMPSAGSNTGVNLAGIYLSPISGTCTSVTLGFVDKTLIFEELEEPFHSFADYTCVACKLHLPIVGNITIPAEFIINKAVSVRYRVDQMNGNTVARVVSDGQVIAELSGNCAYNVPITGGDDGTLTRLGALAGTALELSAGNVAGALAQSAAGLGAQFQTQVANANFNGNATACLNGYAYIEYIYPTTNYPAHYGQTYGYACSVSGLVSEFSGGFGIFEVQLTDIDIPNATNGEKTEIKRLLEEGVVV